MAWILAEASKDWKQSDLDISGTTKALRNFEIVYLLDKGIFGALGTSPSISTKLSHQTDWFSALR